MNPRPSYGTKARNIRSTRRIAAVADVVSMYAESYAPERDFYGPMRRALLDGSNSPESATAQQPSHTGAGTWTPHAR
jgi:hypothetical protein